MSGDAPAREARWKATALYRSEAGLIDVEMYLHELADLHDRIERGPHWDTLVHILVERVNRREPESFTIEQARGQ
jgi:hypothetical protein